MWVQIIKTRLKAGMHDAELSLLMDQFNAAEQPGSGLIRTTAMREQNDPNSLYMVVVFDSEEAARAREQDPQREERLKAARDTMAEIFDAPPEFIDLTVVSETAY